MRRWGCLVVIALVIAGIGWCVSDQALPTVRLHAAGEDVDGLLISSCWRQFFWGACQDGVMREPPVHEVRAAVPLAVRVDTRPNPREIGVAAGDTFPPGDPVTLTYTGPIGISVGAGTHYVMVSARWDRGDALYVFALRVVPP